MKKISVILVAGILIQWPTQIATYENQQPALKYSNSINYDEEEDNDDDDFKFSNENSINNLSLDGIQTSHETLTRSGKSALPIYAFFSIIDGQPEYQQALLNTPIYQQTSPIRYRPILEYPFNLTFGFDEKQQNTISLVPFLNYASTKNYTHTDQYLSSYFLLGNPTRIKAIEYIDTIIGLNIADKLATSFALFDPATVEERRLGGILESHTSHKNWHLIAQLPILYTERNLYLTPLQKAAVKNSTLGSMLKTDGVNENDFIYQHIVMDQVGLGDLKLKAMYEVHGTDTFDIDLGGFIILPTATPFAQGIAGVWFSPSNDKPYLDLTSINPAGITPENQDDIANFFLGAIDTLSSNILNCPLGNNGHVVFAPSINFDWYVTPRFQWSNDFSLQVALPSEEQRFYQKTQTPAQFLQNYNNAFDAGPDTFALFVNQQLQDMFFPYVFSTTVYPGVVFNSTNQIGYHLRTTDIFFGGNFWYQGAEQIKWKTNVANNQNFSYDYQGSTAAYAAQEKLFARINYNVEALKASWSISGYADATIWNSGIGNDYTVAVSIDCKF